MARHIGQRLSLTGTPLFLIAAAVTGGCGLVGGIFGVHSIYEEPAFTVEEGLSESVEVRRYPAVLAAEVEVEETDQGDASGEAFRILFDYITGANRAGDEVAMTVPVEMREPEEIAMTVPVEMAESAADAVTMRFFLPSEYTLSTAPEPTNPRVNLVEVMPRTLAVLRWSGSMTEEAFRTRRAELLTSLRDSRWEAAGEATALVYDPPFAIPSLRRSEVAVPVILRSGESADEL